MYVEVNSDWSDALLNALLIQCHKTRGVSYTYYQINISCKRKREKMERKEKRRKLHNAFSFLFVPRELHLI